MDIKVINESGYKESLLGLSLSYNQPMEKMPEVARKLAGKGLGHDKFLESIYIWLDVRAPRFWWQEADTYRLTTKQSESTMHTLSKRGATWEDFEYTVEPTVIEAINKRVRWCSIAETPEEKTTALCYLKGILPEGFIQRRIWVMNYKCLQNIYNQRKNHRLPQWHKFLDEVLSQVEHPEFIKNDKTI